VIATPHPMSCPTCSATNLQPELASRSSATSKCNGCGRRCVRLRLYDDVTLDYVAYLTAVGRGEYCDDCRAPEQRPDITPPQRPAPTWSVGEREEFLETVGQHRSFARACVVLFREAAAE
jgi:hypothetical protein